MVSKKKWREKKFFYVIILISTTISSSYITSVYLLEVLDIERLIKYLVLFTLSFIFAFTLFKVIFKQQDKLRAEREQLLNLFEHVSDGIIILDSQKKIVEMNQASKKLVGKENQPDLFCNLCGDAHVQFKICDYEKCFLNHNQLSYYELYLNTSHNQRIPVSVSTSSYKGENNQQLMILSIRNLSEYRKGEQNRINNMVTTTMMKAQEEERKRLSRELHDGIGQSIFSVQLGLEYLIPLLDNNDVKEQVDNLRKTTKHTLEEIRHMAVELRPSVLDDLGLIAALKSYFKTFGDTFGIQINFEYTGDKKRLTPTMETALYRITQEALTNVAKYADSERVDIIMCKAKDNFTLKITDYGQGFSAEDLKNKQLGVGLYSMEERAAMLDGTLHITSQIGKGTEIKVRIPLGKDGEDVR